MPASFFVVAWARLVRRTQAGVRLNALLLLVLVLVLVLLVLVLVLVLLRCSASSEAPPSARMTGNKFSVLR